jgi:hypothetical protein
VISGTQLTALQTTVLDQVLLTGLQGLVVVGFLATGLLAAHLLVRAVRSETGEFRIRDARLVLVGASVLFVIGFTRLVTADTVPAESLAGVALGFVGVTYLLYTARPELFDRPDRDGTFASTEDPTN